MVFANLSQRDKEAFFSLLDEYFESRPHLLSTAAISTTTVTATPHGAQSQTQTAGVSPQAAGTVATFGLKQAFKHNPLATAALSNSKVSGKVGDMAARFTNRGISELGNRNSEPSSAPESSSSAGANSKGQPPPPPVRRTSSSINAAPTTGLVSSQRMGDVDVSSKGAFFSSLRGSTAAKTPPAVTPSAAALAAPKRDFDPPPVRRVTPSATPVIRTARTPTPEPEPEREQEKEAGEWVVALYDYAGDAEDLSFSEGQRLFLLEKTSEDWWTGEVKGKKGLFPASYVQPA